MTATAPAEEDSAVAAEGMVDTPTLCPEEWCQRSSAEVAEYVCPSHSHTDLGAMETGRQGALKKELRAMRVADFAAVCLHPVGDN
eukprot:6181189-Pleurochrysis_carterae.AAC.4